LFAKHIIARPALVLDAIATSIKPRQAEINSEAAAANAATLIHERYPGPLALLAEVSKKHLHAR
jgi:hypothetical protein